MYAHLYSHHFLSVISECVAEVLHCFRDLGYWLELATGEADSGGKGTTGAGVPVKLLWLKIRACRHIQVHTYYIPFNHSMGI